MDHAVDRVAPPFGDERLHRAFFGQAVQRGAQNRAAATGIVLRQPRARCHNPLLYVPVPEAGQNASFRFYALEFLPRCPAKAVGQRFDAARAEGRVRDMVEVAFAGHDELGVAGNAARKAGRQTVGDRVRQD